MSQWSRIPSHCNTEPHMWGEMCLTPYSTRWTVTFAEDWAICRARLWGMHDLPDLIFLDDEFFFLSNSSLSAISWLTALLSALEELNRGRLNNYMYKKFQIIDHLPPASTVELCAMLWSSFHQSSFKVIRSISSLHISSFAPNSFCSVLGHTSKGI